MPALYHFTCEHGAERIADAVHVRGRTELLPAFQPLLNTALIWMTDDPDATPAALGFAQPILLACDRSEYRFTIPKPNDAVPWHLARRIFHRAAVHALESKHGVIPDAWYVSTEPQTADAEPERIYRS